MEYILSKSSAPGEILIGWPIKGLLSPIACKIYILRFWLSVCLSIHSSCFSVQTHIVEWNQLGCWYLPQWIILSKLYIGLLTKFIDLYLTKVVIYFLSVSLISRLPISYWNSWDIDTWHCYASYEDLVSDFSLTPFTYIWPTSYQSHWFLDS